MSKTAEKVTINEDELCICARRDCGKQDHRHVPGLAAKEAVKALASTGRPQPEMPCENSGIWKRDSNVSTRKRGELLHEICAAGSPCDLYRNHRSGRPPDGRQQGRPHWTVILT